MFVSQAFWQTDKNRQLHEGDAEFTDDSHQNTFCQKCVEAVEAKCDNGDKELTVWGDPVEFNLGIKCEEELNWEIQCFPNDLAELTDLFGGQHFFALMFCETTGIEKPTVRNTGCSRVVTIPTGGEDTEEEDPDPWTLFNTVVPLWCAAFNH